MSTRLKLTLLMLVGFLLAACSQPPKFVAPEIDPPADLIPGYVPGGFALVSGFQLPGTVQWPAVSRSEEENSDPRLGIRFPFAKLKSPEGNDIQGVYYQGKEHLLLITKSYFPEGTLDLWKSTYETSWPKPCACECLDLRPEGENFLSRFTEIQEERSIDGARVAILKGPFGWTTVFVRGDYLLTVESGISLEENLKVGASLLKN